MQKKRVFHVLILLVFFASIGFSQNNKSNKAIADAYFQTAKYAFALTYYLKEYKKESNAYTALKIADSYKLCQKYDKAEEWYAKLKDTKYMSPSSIYSYAETLKIRGKYEEAKEWFKEYMVQIPTQDSICKLQIASCDSAMAWNKNPEPYTVDNIRAINSEYSEISPALYEMGLVFSSSRENPLYEIVDEQTGLPFYDLYYSEKKPNGKWLRPHTFSASINSKYHEISCSFSANSDTVYYSRSEIDTSSLGNSSLTNRLRIYRSAKERFGWSKPEFFVFNDSLASFGQPTISNNGKLFIFASDLPGGFGGVDLYVSFRVDTTWTIPINLGPTVNTDKDEVYPFFHKDGTLYFSSNGHLGMGGFDIFSVKLVKGKWRDLENLKAPINSSYDDFSMFYSFDKKTGYFSSNRPGGAGREDIYVIDAK